MASNRMYGECLRNHAVKLGLYANDGCGEFMLDTVNPSSLMCDACKCHRSFHRRLSTSPPLPLPPPPPPLPPLPPPPPPARPLRIAEPKLEEKPMKFTAKQEGKMKKFAKKLGWRIISDEADPEVDKFCAEIGVSKENFITWLLDNDVENFLPRIACSSSESASVNKI